MCLPRKLTILSTAVLLLAVTGTGLTLQEPRTGLPDPWDLDSTTFRPGGTLIVEANVTDGTASEITLTIEGPSFNETVSMQAENGTYRRQYRLPADAGEGIWTANVTADGVSNSTAFTVSGLETTTFQVNRSERSDEGFWIDGEEATDGIYTDLSFPYAVGVADGVMTGLIGYGDVRTVGYDGGDPVTFNVTQGIADAVTLLPVAPMNTAELDRLADRFGKGGSGQNTFLDPGRVAFGYSFDADKEVRVTLSYQDSDSVILQGFSGSLAPGLYELQLTNEGTQDGRSIISIER